MRVLFTVSSWPTHFVAMVPLGWALQADCHEVRVLCPPSQAEPVSRAGLVPVPVLDGMDVVTHNRLLYFDEAKQGQWPYPWLPPHPITGGRMSTLDDFDLAEYRRTTLPVLGERAGRSFDAAVAFARSWQPDLIIHDPMSLEGLLAARVIGVPAALALWGPTGTHEPDHVRIVPDDISGSFRRYGLGEFTPDLIEHVIDPCPAALRPPTTADRLPVRYVPYNLAGSAPDWVWEEPSRPRVCVSWSTALSIMSGPDSYALPQIIRGVAALDVEVVVTATRQDVVKLGSVEPSIRVLEHCPLRLLLPTCDAVVHHGGAGTTLTAVSAGVPQVVLTYASEQARNGERVVNAGIGRHLPGHLVDVEQISAAVADVVSDSSYGRSADVVRDEMRRRPTPVELVATLEKLIRG